MLISKEKSGWAALLTGSNGIKSIALSGGVMLHATDVYLATTIMPSITSDIGGLNFYSWGTTVYIVAAMIGSVLSSRNLVKQGPRAAYRNAILLFSIGALICALAPSIYIFLAGRFVQGIGGGLLFALSYAMVSIVFEEKLWPRAMAMISAMWGISSFSGPFIGGIFAQLGNWRYAFFTMLGIAFFIVLLTEIVLPKKETGGAEPAKIPFFKLLLITFAALSISAGSITTNIAANIAGVAGAFIFILALVLSEKNATNRLLPHNAYKIFSKLGSTYLVISLLAIASTVEIYVPYFMQEIHHFSPLKAGYLTVLISIGWSAASLVFAGMDKHAHKMILMGPVFIFIGLVGLSMVLPSGANTTGIGFTGMCLLLISIGAGVGMGWSHLLTNVLTAAPQGEEAKASASISTVQLLATSFGTALAGLVANSTGILSPGGIAGAQQAAGWLMASFALAPLLAFLLLIKNRKR